MVHVKKTKIRKGDLIFYCAILTIPILNLIVFYFYGNANSFLLAVKSYNPNTGTFYFSGFSAFKRAFEDFGTSLLLRAMLNSTLSYAVGLLIMTPLTILFSYYIFKGFPLSNALRVIFFIPSLIASIVLVMIFKNFVGMFLPKLAGLMGFTMPELLSDPTYALPTILLYGVIIGFGGGTLLYSGTMKAINESVLESARLDGVNSLQEMTKIVLPLIWPTFATFVVTGVAGLFTGQMNLYDIYGTTADYKLYTLGYYTFLKTTANGSFADYPYLSAIGLILTFFTIPLTFLVRWAMTKFGPSVD